MIAITSPGSVPGGRRSRFVRWEPLDDAPKDLRLISRGKGRQDGHERLAGRAVVPFEADFEVAVLRVKVGMGPVAEALGQTEVPAGHADVAVDEPGDLVIRQS